MRRLMDWLDLLAERACHWLNAIIPGQHPLALAGYGLAGVEPGFWLPLDRRLGPNVVHMGGALSMTENITNHNYGDDPSDRSHNFVHYPRAANDTACGFWAYCHISGAPCQRCVKPPLATINSLQPGDEKDIEALCKMMGKKGGVFWAGCCKDPRGTPRYLLFADCCSPIQPPPAAHPVQDCGGDSSTWCHAWPAAKNWCFSGGALPAGTAPDKVYYCTVVIHMDAGDKSC